MSRSGLRVALVRWPTPTALRTAGKARVRTPGLQAFYGHRPPPWWPTRPRAKPPGISPAGLDRIIAQRLAADIGRLSWSIHSEQVLNTFVGAVENVTADVLDRARVEVHLSNRVELGSTNPVVLRPGEIVYVLLPATATPFDGWSPHAEVGASGAEGSGEHSSGGEGSEGGEGENGPAGMGPAAKVESGPARAREADPGEIGSPQAEAASWTEVFSGPPFLCFGRSGAQS